MNPEQSCCLAVVRLAASSSTLAYSMLLIKVHQTIPLPVQAAGLESACRNTVCAALRDFPYRHFLIVLCSNSAAADHSTSYRNTVMYVQAAGLDQPAGTMYALPLLDFPYGHYVMSAKWHMLHGRSKDEHHLFPVPVPEGPDACQRPRLPADYFRTEALDVDLQIAVGT